MLAHIRHELSDNPDCRLCKARYLDEVADYIGMVSREQQNRHTGGGGVTAGFSPTVSPPIEMLFYEKDSLSLNRYMRLDENHP